MQTGFGTATVTRWDRLTPSGHSGWSSTTRLPVKPWARSQPAYSLTGYAVELGASNARDRHAGGGALCRAVPAVAGSRTGGAPAQPACHRHLGRGYRPLVSDRRRDRAISRAATAGIITLVVCVALYQAMAAVAGCAWNSWMRDLVPENEFGRFFGRRAAATTACRDRACAALRAADRCLEASNAGTSCFCLFGAVHRQCRARLIWASGCCRSRRSSRCRRLLSARVLSRC